MEGDRSGATEDLRVRSAAPPPSPASSPSEKEYDGRIVRLASSSDEEWVETASEASSATSRSKHIRSEESSLPRSSVAGSSDEPEGILAAPPRRTQFESWSDLEDYLKLYESETYQSFRVRTKNKVADRNKNIRESGSKAPLVPEEWINYARTFICTHGVKYKAKGKGKESGSAQEPCSAARSGGSKWPKVCSKLTSVRLEHNHPLPKHTYNQYPDNRTALERDVQSTVDHLRRAGAKKKNILANIHDNSSCMPTEKDIHNLVNRLKKQEHPAPISAKRLKRWMMEFAEEPGNIGRIFVDNVQDNV
ncbi:hypothetical protein PPTG_07244 [Phytophthora nicotianae INRA-310]|uniref:FAR1 domain-containing protein n=1 Tax=Phytophthora nicotianae (strain INRA-310) TaxID=761204 RepID=W2QRY6_PHYN3|nr:hypothetical protein PPTG_07244 [Phytophthora nicotianae INRA-310]ETN15025.1 hypothetical protein PPTG_07244 [Phytophthora nicotianae INRA-310]